jgi:hypothetical protein
MTKAIRRNAAALALVPFLAFGTAHASEVSGTFGSGPATPPSGGSQSEVEGNFGTGGGDELAGTVVGGSPDGGESGLSGSVRGGSSSGFRQFAEAGTGETAFAESHEGTAPAASGAQESDAGDGSESRTAAAANSSDSLLAAVGNALSFGTGNPWLMVVTTAALLLLVGYGVSAALAPRRADGTELSDF